MAMSSRRNGEMAPSDLAWYHMDRPDNQMVINVLGWSDRPLDPQQVLATLQERWLSAFPRLRQRVRGDRLGIARHPRWVEDESFHLMRHLHFRRLREPGDLAELRAYVSQQAAVRLEHTRPLWELHVLSGFGDGGALFLRLHHAIADGHLVVRLLRELDESQPASLADEVAQSPPGEVDSRHEPESSRATRARGNKVLPSAPRMVSGMMDLASLGAVALDEPSGAESLRAKLSGNKELRWLPEVSIDTIKQPCRPLGLTLNDFWVAAFSGGLRGYLLKEDHASGAVRAVVPVDLRARGEPIDIELGNHFGLVFALLPVSEPSPLARVAAVKRVMDHVKASQEARITFDWICAAGRAGATLGTRMMDQFSRHCSAILSNVPGPSSRIVVGGATIEGLVAWVPTSGQIGVGLCVQSYAGSVNFGMSVDRAVIRDPDLLLEEIRTESESLLAFLQQVDKRRLDWLLH